MSETNADDLKYDDGMLVEEPWFFDTRWYHGREVKMISYLDR